MDKNLLESNLTLKTCVSQIQEVWYEFKDPKCKMTTFCLPCPRHRSLLKQSIKLPPNPRHWKKHRKYLLGHCEYYERLCSFVDKNCFVFLFYLRKIEKVSHSFRWEKNTKEYKKLRNLEITNKNTEMYCIYRLTPKRPYRTPWHFTKNKQVERNHQCIV